MVRAGRLHVLIPAGATVAGNERPRLGRVVRSADALRGELERAPEQAGLAADIGEHERGYKGRHGVRLALHRDTTQQARCRAASRCSGDTGKVGGKTDFCAPLERREMETCMPPGIVTTHLAKTERAYGTRPLLARMGSHFIFTPLHSGHITARTLLNALVS